MTERHVGRIVLGLGGLVIVYGAVAWWHGEQVFARMERTTCTLVIKTVESKLLVDTGYRRRAFSGPQRVWYSDEARLVFAHTLDGRKYTFREDMVGDAHARYEERRAYPCRYDPHDPGHATVATFFDPREHWQTIALGIVLMVLGALIPHSWRSARARWAEMRRPI